MRNGNRWQAVAVDADHHRIAARRLTDGARAVFDCDYVRDHISHGYAVTVHAAQGVTADTTHAVLGEKASRATLYVAMTRGRESNHAYLYERIAEAAEYSQAGPGGLHVARRGSSRAAAHLLRRSSPPMRAHRPYTNSPRAPVESVCHARGSAAHRPPHPHRRPGQPPTAIGAQRSRSGRPVTNRAPTSTYTNRLMTASSCSGKTSQRHVVRSFFTGIKAGLPLSAVNGMVAAGETMTTWSPTVSRVRSMGSVMCCVPSR